MSQLPLPSVSNDLYTVTRTHNQIVIGLVGTTHTLFRLHLADDGSVEMLDDPDQQSTSQGHPLTAEVEDAGINLGLLDRLTQCVESIYSLWATSTVLERDQLVHELRELVLVAKLKRLSPDDLDEIQAVITLKIQRSQKKWLRAFVSHLDQLATYGASPRVIQALEDHLMGRNHSIDSSADRAEFLSKTTGRLLPFPDWVVACRQEHRESPVPRRISATEWQDLLLAAEKYLDALTPQMAAQPR